MLYYTMLYYIHAYLTLVRIRVQVCANVRERAFENACIRERTAFGLRSGAFGRQGALSGDLSLSLYIYIQIYIYIYIYIERERERELYIYI